MKNKPVKRSPYIIKLSRDHHASLLFCWKLRQGMKLHVAAERMRRYVAYFAKDHLAPHFREEEEILFAAAVDDTLVGQAMREHDEINNLVSAIATTHLKELPALLGSVADRVDAHVRFEERVLFPHLEKIIPEDQLKEISEQLDHDPEKDTYEDDFWVKPKVGSEPFQN